VTAVKENADELVDVFVSYLNGAAEKVSRLKLKHGSADGLGTSEALEFLVIGIHGKWALWRALAEVASFDRRLQGVDFGELAARAENQHQKVEERG
jgi:hypothetical protein